MFLYVSVIVLNHILSIFCRLCCKINKNFLYNNTYNIFFFCFYIFFAGVCLVLICVLDNFVYSNLSISKCALLTLSATLCAWLFATFLKLQQAVAVINCSIF